METVLLIIAAILFVSAMNIMCFLVGARTGQQVENKEPIELPSLDPMKAYREHKERREAEREQDKLDTIIRNIERYDGTGAGQEEVR
jgi:hypothetical protein